MVKFRLYFNKDKETEYLNSMSDRGYALNRFAMGFYSFEECEPCEYIYQIDITEGFFRVGNNYREFMKDMDVEIVCLWGPWVILRKRAADGPFVLYTDVESNIEQYMKIKWMFRLATIIEICCLAMEVLTAINTGMVVAWALSFVLLALIIAFIRELSRINDILTELKSRTGAEAEVQGKRNRRRKLSGFLAAGCLLNGIGCLMPRLGAGEQADFLYGFLKGSVHGLAIVFLILGLVNTLRGSE